MNRLRLLVSILSLFALGSTVVACGGGGGEDPQKVLDQTLSSHSSIKSGKLNLKLAIDIHQQGNEGGSVNAEISGPFENQGAGELPKFDLDVSGIYHNFDTAAESPDSHFGGELISTGDAMYIALTRKGGGLLGGLFQGNFKLQQSQFALLKGAVLAIPISGSLLTNLSNEGDADVDGTPTTHISGDLNVDKAPAVLDFLHANAGGLRYAGLGFLGGSPLPADSEVIAGLNRLIDTARVDVYSAKQDHLLRRLTLHLSLNGVSVRTVDVTLDAKLNELNQPQTIEAPPNPKPFSELIRQFNAFAAAVGD
jgi:hypothetical protein